MMRTQFLILLIAMFLFSCSNTESAGVMTEANTGNKLAGIIIDGNGHPVPFAKVKLVDSLYLEGHDSMLHATQADKNGYFEINSISQDTLRLLVSDSLKKQTLALDLIFFEQKSKMDLGELSLFKSAMLVIKPSDYELKIGDSVFIVGAGVVQQVDEVSIEKDIIIFVGIAPGEYAIAIKQNNLISNKTEYLIFEESDQLSLKSGQLLHPTLKAYFLIPDSLAKEYGVVKKIPIPIRISTEIKNPCLIDANGNLILLDSILSKSDSVFYWGNALQVDFTTSSTIGFNVLENCSGNSNESLGHLSLHFDNDSDLQGVFGSSYSLTAEAEPYFVSLPDALPNDNAVGVSFWIKADSSEQSGEYNRILTSATSDSTGFIVQRRGVSGSVNLRINTKGGDYNALFGTSPILDGEWHSYSFTIREDSVIVVIDGKVISKTTFDLGEGFNLLKGFNIGGNPSLAGGIDELMIFDGSQSALWWSAFYTLQKNYNFWKIE